MTEEEKEMAEKASKRAELVNNMSGKERHEYYKKQTKARKEKLNLLTALKADVNKQIMFPKEEMTEEEHIELLQRLQDLDSQIVAIKRNKNNSHFYSWYPNIGFNRQQRKQNGL